MARKSRKVDFVPAPQVTVEQKIISDLKPVEKMTVYRAGLYARLSFEDEGNKERGTIETQMELIRQFVQCQEDIVVEKEYYDISKTGTNFERDGFQEMMEDIKSGLINCVIVKDLSRLGRNYVEAGNYVERVFPFYEVRFIAITDNYDSLVTNEPILLGVSNIFNEMYVRDVSKKVRAGYKAIWDQGLWISGSIPYGYKKDSFDHRKYVIDEEPAEVVKMIFNLMLDDQSYGQIANLLNEKGILSPKAYKQVKAGNEPTYKWSKWSVVHILENYNYTGNSVHNKYECSRIGGKTMKLRPEEEWIYTPNTHPAIISMDTYEKVKKMRMERTEKGKVHKNPGMYSARELNFFKGKCFCADCGGPMYLGRHDKQVRYYCGNHSLKKICFAHYVSDTKVNDEVLRVIHSHINIYTDNVQMIRRLNGKKTNVAKYDIFAKEVRKLQKELEKVAKHRNELYEDYVSRIIDAEQYLKFKKDDEETEKRLTKQLEEMLSEKSKYDTSYKSDEEWDALIESYRDKRLLTKKMVDAFVKKVTLDRDGNAIVELIYDDFLKDLVSYAKEREVQDEE